MPFPFDDMMENSTIDTIELSETIRASSAKIAEHEVNIQNILNTKSESVQELEQLTTIHSSEVQGLQAQVQGFQAQVQGFQAQIQGFQAQIQDIETQIQTLETNFNTERERLETKIADNDSEIDKFREEIRAESFAIIEASATLSMENSRRDRVADFTKKWEENAASARLDGTVHPLPFINGGELPCEIRKIEDILIMDLNTVDQFLIGYNLPIGGSGLQRKIRLAITVGYEMDFASRAL